MKLLLDTHALLWFLAGDERVPPETRARSAASSWEVATKVRLGKLSGAELLGQEFPVEIARRGFLPLPITLEHAQRAGFLPGPHKHPFDRMLIAQAQAENLRPVWRGSGVVK